MEGLRVCEFFHKRVTGYRQPSRARNLPDLTGPVLAERLRAKQPDLRVLFISGFHDADLVQRFVTRRGFTLLPKPFTVEALLRGVQEALQPVKS